MQIRRLIDGWKRGCEGRPVSGWRGRRPDLQQARRKASAPTGREQMAKLLSRQVSDTLKGCELHLKVAMNTLTFLALMYSVNTVTLDKLARL